jgi:hypothetical protein
MTKRAQTTLWLLPKSGDGQAELPLMSICAICGERMIVYEPGQTTHPNCDPDA